MNQRHIAVLGAGSWGTALALLLADKGYPLRLWAKFPEEAEAIKRDGENITYLKGFKIPDNIVPTSDLAFALNGADLVVVVVPTHGLRDTLRYAAPLFPANVPIVSATKGIENETLMLISEIYAEHLPPQMHNQMTFLSGPSFAREVAAKIPTAVAMAGTDEAMCRRAQDAFSTDRFRVYWTDDVVGVEMGGALKNVVAIAAGISDGLGFGDNARAALITRGLAEISRLAIKRGANPLTIAGLSGMGDLVLTCTGDLSRNRTVGLELGRGKKIQEILAGMKMVAEGVRTTKSTYNLARREQVEMPIVDQVYAVLYEDRDPHEAVGTLMTRPQKHERE